MTESNKPKKLKGTWGQALLTFLFPVLLVLVFRWAFFEPFVIPSGSMIPNLLVHDHILVQKFAFGLHFPFSDKWMMQWKSPVRGDIVVFKYPENPDVFYIKRLVGLPGDVIEVQNGHIFLNGEKWPVKPYSGPGDLDPDFSYYDEFIAQNSNKTGPHLIRFMNPEVVDGIKTQTYVVPEGQFFFMGDNRDQSSDSRYWGYVKNDYLVGKAWLIWLSCHSTLPTMSFVCDPSQIRWSRFFKVLN